MADLMYTLEKFEQAAFSLASTSGSVRERLQGTYLAVLSSDAFATTEGVPEEVSKRVAGVFERWTVEGETTEDTIGGLSEVEAHDLAQEIVSLALELRGRFVGANPSYL